MTNLYVTYIFKDSAVRDKFYESVKVSGADVKSRAEEGCIRYEYFYPAETDNRMFLWEQWESKEAIEAHKQTAHFAELGKLKEQFEVDTDILVQD